MTHPKKTKLLQTTDSSTDDPFALHPSDGEFNKGLFDHLKHVATLATGSILTVATLLQNVFKQPIQTNVVPLAVVLFLVCIAASMVTFAVLAMTYPRPKHPVRTNGEANFIVGGFVCTWSTFVLGVGCVGWFFIANWNALYK